MTTTALGQMNPCPHCSNPPYNYVYHYGGVCPKIKAVEYYPDGTVKRIEYKEAETYQFKVDLEEEKC